MNYWLMKSEPSVYSFLHLKQEGQTLWEGVRNYQARNFMTQSMQVGDLVLFYHSSEDPVGVAGIAKVGGPAIPDPTQFSKKSDYFDPKASPEKPIWYCVRVEFARELPRFVSLAELRAQKSLANMQVLKKGQRLSIQPVTREEFQTVLNLAGLAGDFL